MEKKKSKQEEEYCLKLDEQMREVLINNKLPFNSLKEFTNTDTISLLVFSDYAGDKPSCEYETYGYYLTDYNSMHELAVKIQKLKIKANIRERTFAYKNRKDKLRKRVFPTWIEMIREHSGLLLLIAYEKSFMNEKVVVKNNQILKQELVKREFPFSKDKAMRVVRAISFLPLVAHLLQPNNKLGWFTDRDEIMDTPKKSEQVGKALQDLANEVLGHELASIGYGTAFTEKTIQDKIGNLVFENILSIADILASSFGACLTKTKELDCPDEEAAEIMRELAKFQNVHDKPGDSEMAHIACYVFDNESTKDNPNLVIKRISLIPR